MQVRLESVGFFLNKKRKKPSHHHKMFLSNGSVLSPLNTNYGSDSRRRLSAECQLLSGTKCLKFL